MRKLLIVPTVLALGFLAGGDGGNKPLAPALAAEREMSMDDGVKYEGVYMPLSALRNILAMKLIMVCLGKNVGRFDCQCAVDNFFKDMDAREFNEFLESRGSLWGDDRFLAAREYCADKPREKIPPTGKEGPMIGGEARTFIMKEIVLDCLGSGGAEKQCLCYAEGVTPLFENPIKVLEVIDGRKENMAGYRPPEMADKMKKRYVDCGLK